MLDEAGAFLSTSQLSPRTVVDPIPLPFRVVARGRK